MKKSVLAESLFLLAVALFLGVFLLWPLFIVLRSAIWENGRLTFAYVAAVFSNQGIREGFWNSLQIGIGVTLATTLISLPLAYIFTRITFPLQKISRGLVLLPMVMPPFVGALGLRYFFARCGSFNIILESLGFAPLDFFGSGGLPGVILLETLHLYPIMYLNVTASLASLDESLLESARSLGAKPSQIWRKVILPLMMPGYFAGAIIVFIWAFTDLGTPLVFEFRNCLPVLIFDRVTDMQSNPAGYALVMLMLLATSLFFVIGQRFSGNIKVISTSKGSQAAGLKKPTGIWLILVYAFLFATLILALLPHLSVILVAFSDRWFMSVLPESYTLQHFVGAFTHKLALSGIRNSFFLSSAATLLDVFFGLIIGYLLARRKAFWKSSLDLAVMLPLAVPGIVLAFGYLSAFSGRKFWGLTLDPLVNPFPLLIICYGVRRLPYIVRSVYAGFQHLGEGLEEAGRSLGAGFATVMRRITLPLLSTHVLAGALLTFAFCVFEVGATLLLAAREWDYPLSKTIYALNLRLGDGPCIASAMGVLGMLLLGGCLLTAGTLLGKRMGEIFRGPSS